MPSRIVLPYLDAAESAFFARELEYVKAQTFDQVYAELRSRLFIPVSNEAGAGADAIVARSFDRVGRAKIISNWADDLPRADVHGEELVRKIVSLGASYGYNVQEIRNAARARRPLQTMKAEAARRAIEEQIDEILALGNTAAGLFGFLNDATIPTISATTGNWIAGPATADQIIADLNQAVQTVIDQSLAAEAPDTIILPPAEYTHIAQLPRSTQSDKTVLQFFLEASPWIRNIDHWYRLEGAGAGATDRMVVYNRSANKLTGDVPQEFEQFDVQARGLEFIVPCHARVSGTTVYYPLSAVFSDGI